MRDLPQEITRDTLTLFQSLLVDFAGNSLGDYILALSIILTLLLAVILIRRVLLRAVTAWIERFNTPGWEEARVMAVTASLFKFLLVLPFYLGFKSLVFSPGLQGLINIVFMVLLVWFGLKILSGLAYLFLSGVFKPGHTGTKALFPIVNMAVWFLGLAFLLSNLGVNITSMVAGLGIAGIAVGLASQAILADFFGYLVILLDQPFRIGDKVAVGSILGIVEKVGLKTTQLRSLEGELIYYPNGELSKQILRNFYHQHHFVKIIQFGITYETPLEKIKQTPLIVRQVVESQDNTAFTRANLVRFDDSSLLFEAVFSVKTGDLGQAMEIQHRINIGLIERFAQEGIEFAYPTQVVHMLPTPGTLNAAGRLDGA